MCEFIIIDDRRLMNDNSVFIGVYIVRDILHVNSEPMYGERYIMLNSIDGKVVKGSR
jgi:hypothetical protein